MEGAVTIAIGIGSYFIMVDFPTSKRNRFLTPEEAALVEARLLQERGEDRKVGISLPVIWNCLKDWKVWLLFVEISHSHSWMEL